MTSDQPDLKLSNFALSFRSSIWTYSYRFRKVQSKMCIGESISCKSRL